MLTPERLLRLVIEIIFVLLGLLVVWLGLTGHIFFDRHKLPWLVLSVALILWGIRGIYRKPGEQAAAAGRLYPRGFADGFGYSAAGDFAGAVCVGGAAAGVCRGSAGGARHRGIRAIVTARWRPRAP